MATGKKLPLAIAIAVVLVTFCWFAFSRLAFSPVPWPDGSAFYLPSLDLLAWPPHWRMHSQAAFVPTYDDANFNMMPLLPLILGILTQLGLGSLLGGPLAIKVISLGAFMAWGWVLWSWLRKSSHSLWVATAVGLAGLWDPVIRWGAMVVRSEIWIGLIWVLLLRELSSFQGLPNRSLQQKRSFWMIAMLLALAAYFHFEAIILVPATAIGLYRRQQSSRELEAQGDFLLWLRSLAEVGGRTLLLLLPWVIYVLSYFSLFREQMDTQFHRLERGNLWIKNSYLLFHSLFLELGSPIGVPKFFNVAKAVFWLLLILVTALTLNQVTLDRFGLKKLGKGHLKKASPSSDSLPLCLAAGAAFWASFYLWCSKPEVWFISLCHLTLWPWLGLILMKQPKAEPGQGFTERKHRKVWTRGFLLSGAAAYAVLALGADLVLSGRIDASYTWSTYQDWVSCIERTVVSQIKKDRPQIWQPHIPDVLVELSSRRPQWDLVRTLDFEALRPQAQSYSEKTDAIIMSRFFDRPLKDGEGRVEYEGPERAEDRALISTEEAQPFGPWILEQLPVLQPGQWQRKVCRVGPYFADIALRGSGR